MKQITQHVNHANDTLHITFTETNTHDIFDNITQAYGICMTQDGKAMIVQSPKTKLWILPGGTLEEGETPEETLHRKVDEEADISITNLKLLGGQRVRKNEEPYVDQLRYTAWITEIREQTPDPDTNTIGERKLVALKELNTYLNWGTVGEYLQEQAIQEYDKK